MDGQYLIKGAVTGAVIFGMDTLLTPFQSQEAMKIFKIAIEGIGIVAAHSLIYPDTSNEDQAAKEVVVAGGLLAITDILFSMDNLGGPGPGSYFIKVLLQGLVVNWGLEYFLKPDDTTSSCDQ